MTSAQRHRFLENIISDARRLDLLLARLRELAQAELPIAHGESSLETVLPKLREQFPRLHISGNGTTSMSMAMPTETATIVLSNLAENASQHGATELILTVAASGKKVNLIVQDDGQGIALANRDKIFSPFFSTRREEGGTGLGLDIVRAMLGAYGGSIELIGSSAGAAFAITLPISARQASRSIGTDHQR